MNTDMDTYQFISLIIGIVGLAWGWHKYLVKRMDAGDSKVLNKAESETKLLHDRISKARDGMVPRHEFDREVARFHSELRAVRDEVITSRTQQTERMDQILHLLVSNKKE